MNYHDLLETVASGSVENTRRLINNDKHLIKLIDTDVFIIAIFSSMGDTTMVQFLMENCARKDIDARELAQLADGFGYTRVSTYLRAVAPTTQANPTF